MNFATDVVDVLGLLALLASAAVVFATLAQWLTGKRRNQVRLGVEMLVFAAVAWAAVDPVTRWAGSPGMRADLAGMAATLWWLSLAFLIDAAITKYIWRGRMAVRGETTVPRILTGFVTVLIYTAAIMSVMHFVYDEPITAIAATSGAFAFVIGYSAQATLGELFAGISVNASRSLKKGDLIDIDGVFGNVYDVDWRSVTVFEFASKTLVVIPNSVLASKPFHNYAQPTSMAQDSRRITVEFSAPPDVVIEAVKQGLRECPLVMNDPGPDVRIQGPNEFGMAYQVLWTMANTDDWFPAQRQALSSVWASLKKHDIQPGLNHAFTGPGGRFDENAWTERHRETEADHIAALAASPVLAALSAEDRAELVRAASRREHAPRQPITAMGGTEQALYVVVSGRVAVELTYDDGEIFEAMDLRAGDVFGVTNLVSGAARTSQVVSAEYGALLCIPAEALAPKMAAVPAFREALGVLADERLAEFDRRRKAHGVVVRRRAREEQKQRIHGTLAGRLGGLFKGGRGKAVGKKRIVEASMAAAALVAAADGVIEDAERDEVIRTFEDLELGHFMDFDKAIQRFDAYCDTLIPDGEDGARKVMDELRPLARDPASAEIVLDICISISAADGEVEEPEEKRIAEIRAALDLAETPEA